MMEINLYVSILLLLSVYEISSHENRSSVLRNLKYLVPKSCSKPGLMCKSCEYLVNCIQTGDKFVEHLVETCSAPDTYCLVNECTNKPNPQCPDIGHYFKCNDNSIGLFPDPFDCKLFHVCLGQDNPLTFSCSTGYGYDPLSTYCKVKLVNDGCPDQFPVPVCKKVGDNGPVPNNKSIYYICTKRGEYLHPELHLCPHGKLFSNNICT